MNDKELTTIKQMVADGAISLEVAEKYFPELKESEDERIRKSLMQNLKERFGTKGNMGKGLDMPDVLAWLEKQHTPNPYSGVSFDYNGHTWGMCARDGGVEILVDSKLYTSISADKSKADKTLIRRPFKLLAGHRYFCIKTPVWTDHFYQIYESINDDKIVDDLGKEHTFSDKINCPPQYWFCEVAEEIDEASYKVGVKRVLDNPESYWLTKQKCQSPIEWEHRNGQELSDFENAMMHIGESFFSKYPGLNPNDTAAIKEQAKLLMELAHKSESVGWTVKDEANSVIINSVIECEIAEYDDEETSPIRDGIQEAKVWFETLKYRIQPPLTRP